MFWLLACVDADDAESAGSDEPALSDLAPILDEAFDYEATCAEVWPAATCDEEPCDLSDTAQLYEDAWRAYVQPRWDLDAAEYEEHVAVWSASQSSAKDRLWLGHRIAVGWHRLVLEDSADPGKNPTEEEAAARWEWDDPARNLDFREPLVSYEDALASAQACADSFGMPLASDTFCESNSSAPSDTVPNLWALAKTEIDAEFDHAIAKVELTTGELVSCDIELCCEE